MTYLQPMVESDLAAVATELDRAASAAADANDIPRLVELPDGPSALRDVTQAFEYTARIPSDPGDRYFGPMFGPPGPSQIPPAFDQLSPESVGLWRAVADLVAVPLARARLKDICFESRWGNGRDNARAAIEAYLQVAAREPSGFDEGQRIRVNLAQVHSFERAIDLARRTNQTDLADQALAAIGAAADSALKDNALGAGVVLGLIETLVDGRAEPVALEPLLERARTRYEGDLFGIVHTIDLQLKVPGIDEARRTLLWREIALAWMAEAVITEGAVRMAHLETAVQVARDHGITDVADEATAKMQAMGVDELGLVRRSYTISIPADQVEQFLATFTNASSWQEALLLIVATGPPSGLTDMNRAAAQQAAVIAPLRASIPHVRVGGDGLPRFVVSTEEEKADWLLTEQETTQIRVAAPIYDDALKRIWQQWGPLSEEQLTAFLTATHVPLPTTESIARAFVRYFNDDAESALYTATPKVEALVRALVLAFPLPVYRIQRAATPGQYPGLGALLPALHEAGMVDSWFRYLYTLLASPMGLSLRNELLHGFVDEVNSPMAALVLIASLYLSKGITLEPVGAQGSVNETAEADQTTTDREEA